MTSYHCIDNAYRGDGSGRIKHRHSDKYLVLTPGGRKPSGSARPTTPPPFKFDRVSPQTDAVTLDAADSRPQGRTMDGLGVRNRTNANGTTSTRKGAYCDLGALRGYTRSGCP